MSKLSLIVKREYITRVTKKSFIIGTLLAPLGLLIYMLVIVFLSRYESGSEIRVAVMDEGRMIRQLPDAKGVRFIDAQGKTFEQLKAEAEEKKIDAVLKVPPLNSFQKKEHTVYFYSKDKLAPEKEGIIEKKIAGKIRDFKIDSLKLDRKSLENLDTDIAIEPESFTGEDQGSKYTAGVGLAIGGLMAFIMFFMVIMYGSMIMRSVTEEKTNRIVEVMMSSVRPFDLMMGKIIGAGLVGLTQVVIWVTLSGAVMFLLPFIVDMDPTQMQSPMVSGEMQAAVDPEAMEGRIGALMAEVSKQNWSLILFSFIVFFLGGYFIYASLFAAIGSAMSDDMGESQALVFPIMIPLILAFYITAFAGIRNPNSGLMVFASLFPLFSPIVMPFRMAFNPPWWQVALSLLLVVASALFFVWLAGRIYRVGILLYGKKATFKEIGKWMFYKG